MVVILLRFCNPSVSLTANKHRDLVNGEESIRTMCFLLVFQFIHSSDCRFNFYCRGHILDLDITSNCLHAGLSVQDIHSFNTHLDLSTKETGLCGMSANFSHRYCIYVGLFVTVLCLPFVPTFLDKLRYAQEVRQQCITT